MGVDVFDVLLVFVFQFLIAIDSWLLYRLERNDQRSRLCRNDQCLLYNKDLADAIVVEDAEDAEDGIADYAWLWMSSLMVVLHPTDMIGWEPAENAQIGSSRLFVRLLEQHGKRLHGWLSWQVQIRQLSGRAEHGCKRAAL